MLTRPRQILRPLVSSSPFGIEEALTLKAGLPSAGICV
jgi:hypothetical protein